MPGLVTPLEVSGSGVGPGVLLGNGIAPVGEYRDAPTNQDASIALAGWQYDATLVAATVAEASNDVGAPDVDDFLALSVPRLMQDVDRPYVGRDDVSRRATA